MPTRHPTPAPNPSAVPDPDATFLAEAIALSRQALTDDVGGPFGAVVVRDGRIVARGRNRVLADNDPTAHAEVVALRRAAQAAKTHQLRGCTVYASCEPCPMCLSALRWARVDRVVFAADRNDAEAAGFDDARFYAAFSQKAADGRLVPHAGLRGEASAVLTAWAQRPDHRLY